MRMGRLSQVEFSLVICDARLAQIKRAFPHRYVRSPEVLPLFECENTEVSSNQ